MSGIGHNGHAVIQGTFSDFKLVKTRAAAQIVVEIPIEEAEAFITAFGIPISGQERHVAVALIQPPAPVPVPRETRVETDSGAPKVEHPNHPKNTAASERFRALGKPEQMVSRCAMTTADPQFWRFIEYCGYGAPTKEGEAAQWVRQQLGIKSRSELASDGHAQSVWEQIVTDYDLWRGAIPEQRG